MAGRTPMDEIERMFQQMSRQIEGASRQWQELGQSTMGAGSGAVDVVDRGDEYEVAVELPGFETDDVDVRIVDQRLSIVAEHTEETATEDDEFVRQERSHQSVSRQVRLPEPVDADDVTATLNNGLLTVTVPKTESADDGHAIDIE